MRYVCICLSICTCLCVCFTLTRLMKTIPALPLPKLLSQPWMPFVIFVNFFILFPCYCTAFLQESKFLFSLGKLIVECVQSLEVTEHSGFVRLAYLSLAPLLPSPFFQTAYKMLPDCPNVANYSCSMPLSPLSPT